MAFRRYAVALAGLVAACNPRESRSFVNEWAFVFPRSSAASLVRQCARPVPGPVDSTWEPDTVTIGRFERALGPAIDSAIRARIGSGDELPDLEEFVRQYGGLFVGGRKIVYVNGFSILVVIPISFGEDGKPADTTWRHSALVSCEPAGQWTWYFGAEYDPESGEVQSFHFNRSSP